MSHEQVVIDTPDFSDWSDRDYADWICDQQERLMNAEMEDVLRSIRKEMGKVGLSHTIEGVSGLQGAA